MQKLRKNDEVVVIAGKSKGTRGRILKIIKSDGKASRVVVEQANMVKKHVKPNPQAGEPGGIKEQEASIHISNVAIWNSASEKADRVGVRVSKNDGSIKSERFFKSNNELID